MSDEMIHGEIWVACVNLNPKNMLVSFTIFFQGVSSNLACLFLTSRSVSPALEEK